MTPKFIVSYKEKRDLKFTGITSGRTNIDWSFFDNFLFNLINN